MLGPTSQPFWQPSFSYRFVLDRARKTGSAPIRTGDVIGKDGHGPNGLLEQPPVSCLRRVQNWTHSSKREGVFVLRQVQTRGKGSKCRSRGFPSRQQSLALALTANTARIAVGTDGDTLAHRSGSEMVCVQSRRDAVEGSGAGASGQRMMCGRALRACMRTREARNLEPKEDIY